MENEFKDLWKIMKAYNGEIDKEILNDLLCSICQKILINPCRAFCGCTYCLECIKKYLDDTEKFCPGNTDECKKRKINFTIHIQLDKIANEKLSKIIVKCPNKYCNFQDKLLMIPVHMKNCQLSSLISSDIISKCRNPKRTVKNTNNNVLLKIFSHSKLFVKCVENLQQENELLNHELLELRMENKILKLNIESIQTRNENSILEFRKQLQEQKQNFDFLKQEMIEIQSLNRDKKEILDTINSKQFIVNELQQNSLNENSNMKFMEIDKKFVRIEEAEINLKKMIKKVKEIEINQNEILNSTNKQQESIEHINKKIIKVKINQELQTHGEFIWKIDHFQDKLSDATNGTKKWLNSESFYSHKYGYKMCLTVYPIGNRASKEKHLSIFFCLMPGDFDDILEWPFKYDVIFSIINQCNGSIFESHKIQYDDLPNHSNRNKPFSNMNGGIGFNDFISVHNLMNNPDLLQNDQLFIKCSVNVS